MKYTVSHLMKRALQLADLSNTDFLTHQEQTDYLNDAWHSLFQVFINNGDKQFVKEVKLNNSSMGTYTEYKIPFDCFQIHSLRNPKSGVLYTRASANSSDTSNTYEIVNDKIRLNGISSDNLVLTYYQNPLYLSFPDKTIELNTDEPPLQISGDNAIFASGKIYNLLTQEEVGSIDLNNISKFILTPGYILAYSYVGSQHLLTVLNYDGYAVQDGITLESEPTLVNGYKTAYYYLNGTLYDVRGRVIKENLTDAPGYVSREGQILYPDGFAHSTYFTQVENFTDYPTFINIKDDYEVEMLELLPNGTFLTTFLDQCDKYFYNFMAGDYGIISTDGTKFYYVSRIPDTECNFPNDLYFQLIAADCAMRYLLKQNADISGINNIYTNMLTTYKNSLSQNGGYARVASVYSDCF